MLAEQQRTRTSRWAMVAAFAGVASATQMVWLTFAPVTTAVSHHYGVSTTAIGWLAQPFVVLYVVLAIPAGIPLDRNLRGWPAAGTGLVALGAVARDRATRTRC